MHETDAVQKVAGDDSREWRLVQRIVSSRSFAKAQRLKSFLLFVCERQIQGRENEISEQRIGTCVFDRAPDYNPGEDSIVRTHARLLRQKLDAYFEDEGAHEALRLTVPRGSYVPVFIANSPVPAFRVSEEVAAGSTETPPTTDGPPNPTSGLFWKNVGAPASLVVLGLAIGLFARPLLTGIGAPRANPFWSRIFNANTDTLFVAADTGLVLFENLTRQNVPLGRYVTRSYAQPGEPGIAPANSVYDLARLRYTGVVDLNMTTRLMKRPELVAARYQFRYSRDLQFDDLKNSNVILSGAAEANPWVDLFQEKCNFRLEHERPTNVFTVTNRKPQHSELPVYVCDYHPGQIGAKSVAFGHIAFLPNLSGAGQVLLIEGTGSAGTEAAVDFLFNESQFQDLLDRVRNNERAVPHFEALVSTEFIGDSRSPRSQLVGFRRLR